MGVIPSAYLLDLPLVAQLWRRIAVEVNLRPSKRRVQHIFQSQIGVDVPDIKQAKSIPDVGGIVLSESLRRQGFGRGSPHVTVLIEGAHEIAEEPSVEAGFNEQAQETFVSRSHRK